MKENEVVNSIIETIQYSNYYDFPLTLEEIYLYMGENINKSRLERIMSDNQKIKETIGHKEGYYFLKGRDQIIDVRKRRQKISKFQKKQIIPVLKKLINIPFVLMIALTGSLAVNNSKTDSDIDFLVVTQSNRVWITRFLLFFVEKYCERVAKYQIDLCFNYIISEQIIKQSTKNIYIAREIVQMQPITGLKYQKKFFIENPWIFQTLPNFNEETYSNLLQASSLYLDPKETLNPLNYGLKSSDNVLINFLLNIIDYLEYRRATANIYDQFVLTGEVGFNRNQYKAHFNQHQMKIMTVVKNNHT